MLHNYLPILVFIVLALAFALVMLIGAKTVAWFTRVNKPAAAKNAPFECGFGEFEDARTRFDVRFYLVAILFIVFDLEVAFLFPWSVVVHKISNYGFIGMGVFLFLLLVGFVYEWKKGALEWE
jgi:NADH-quinone oxidoreductase subunit A